MVSNPYRFLGIVLAATGAILAPVFYFVVGSIPLAATGMSAIIIGFTAIAIANAAPYMSPETAQMLLKTGMENTAALLEELGLRNKALYIPSNLGNGALVPLVQDRDTTNISYKLSGRLIVKYGQGSEEIGIAVTTPGNITLKLLPNKPGPTMDEISSALSYILTGVLDIARSVTVNQTGSRIEVEISGAKMHYEDIWYYRCLGSPIASIAAAISSEALGKPVRIVDETNVKDKTRIILEIVA